MYIKPIGWEFTASDFCCWHGELLNGKQPCMVYGCECSDYEPNGWVYNESFDEV